MMFRATILLVALIFGLSPALAGKGGGGGGGSQSATSHAPTSSPNAHATGTQAKTYKSIGLGMRKSGGNADSSPHF
jgi:hypothetical protein